MTSLILQKQVFDSYQILLTKKKGGRGEKGGGKRAGRRNYFHRMRRTRERKGERRGETSTSPYPIPARRKING